MREIEFRGIGLVDKKFHHGWYMQTVFGIQDLEHRIIGSDGFGNVQIDPVTIGQFTGLRDKNGVKIFCGDILEADGIDYESGNYARGEIVFIDGEFSIQYMHLDRNLYERIISAKRESVVGNKHQHPHLLEQKK